MNHRKSYRQPRASKLEKLGLKKEWLEPWGLAIESIERLDDRNWLLWSQRGGKLLRLVDWTEGRARFICAVLDHLGRNGYRNIPRFLLTMDGRRWVMTENGCFYLCDYHERRKINLQDQNEVETVFQGLSRMHNIFRSFSWDDPETAGQPNISWIDQWEADHKLLNHYRGLLEHEREPNSFESVFLEKYDMLLDLIDDARNLLRETDNETMSSQNCEIVCHGSFKETNLFFTPSNELYIDRFDNCHYNLRIFDLGRFLYRVMTTYNWNLRVGELNLKAYQGLQPLTNEERKILAAFLYYPHPSIAYIRSYFERRGSWNPDELAQGVHSELLRLNRKEFFLDWLHKG